MCTNCISKILFPWQHPPNLLLIVDPLPHRSQSLEKGLKKISSIRLNISVFYFFPIIRLLFYMLINMYKEVPWWRSIFGCSYVFLRVTAVLYPLEIILVSSVRSVVFSSVKRLHCSWLFPSWHTLMISGLSHTQQISLYPGWSNRNKMLS